MTTIVTGGAAGASLAATLPWPRLQSSTDDGTLVVGAFFLIGLFLVYNGFREWQRMRLMQDTPTEKVRSAAAGRTELSGTGHPIDGRTIEQPFADGDCLVATYDVEEWHEDDDGGNWSTIDAGTLFVPFALDDGSGRIRVEPEADATYEISDERRTRIRVDDGESTPAEVVEFLRDRSSVDVPASSGVSGFLFGEDRRYTQYVIPPGTHVYALGGASPVDESAASSADAGTAGPVAAAAGDGGDGAAGAPTDAAGTDGASGEVGGSDGAGGSDSASGSGGSGGSGGSNGAGGVRSNAERLVLHRDESSEEFVISDMTESELTGAYRWRAPAQIVGGIALSAVMLYVLLLDLGIA